MDSVFCSVVVPVLHEGARIADLVAHVRGLAAPGPVEVVVVDGAPEGDTLAALAGIEGPDLVPLGSGPGRAVQMNAGARAARGEAVLFLHADTTLPGRGLELVAGALADAEVAGGAFDLGFGPGATAGQRFIARAANRRSRRTRVPYGDQAIFMRRALFLKRGGFPEIPLMEDLRFMAELRRDGHAIRILDQPVATSPRRWQAEGTVFCTGRNLFIRGLYHLGVPPAVLARLYRFKRHQGDA